MMGREKVESELNNHRSRPIDPTLKLIWDIPLGTHKEIRAGMDRLKEDLIWLICDIVCV